MPTAVGNAKLTALLKALNWRLLSRCLLISRSPRCAGQGIVIVEVRWPWRKSTESQGLKCDRSCFTARNASRHARAYVYLQLQVIAKPP
jgi:hypothetical protein